MESSGTAGSGEFREPVAVLTGFSAELWKFRRSFWRAGRISQGYSGIGGQKEERGLEARFRCQAGATAAADAATKTQEYESTRDYGWESGRRLRVGRSSSVLVGSLPVGCFLDCSVFVRSVGLPGALSVTLRENMMLRRRDFTESNSEVVTMYSCLAGRMRAISFCEFSLLSGVGRCV